MRCKLSDAEVINGTPVVATSLHNHPGPAPVVTVAALVALKDEVAALRAELSALKANLGGGS